MQWAIFIVLSIIFFITPYQKGLYFSYNLYSTGIILSILFILVALLPFIKKDNDQTKGLVVFLLPLALLISLPFAASPKGAWDTLIKWIFYAEFFYLLLWVSLIPAIKKLMPLLFQLNGMALSVFMMLNFYGVLDYRAAILNDRFAGVFQYPNTFGMIMALFLMFAIIQLSSKNQGTRDTLLYSASLVCYTVCFIMSFSRGMMLMLPFVWLVGLLMLPALNQLKYLFITFITFGSSLIVYQAIEADKLSNSSYPGLTILVVMTFLLMGLIFLLEKLITTNSSKFETGKIRGFLDWKFSSLILPVMIMISLFLAFLDLTNEGILFRSIPEKLQERISGINLNAATAQERIYLYEDALEMSKDSPIIGFGGGGWAALYKEYQQIPYQSNKIHNGYLEWLIDSGWLGFVTFLGVLSYLIYLVYKSKQTEQGSTIHIAVITSFIAAASHSILDFNFSFGTVMLILFWLLAMGISVEQARIDIKSLEKNRLKINALKLVTVIVVLVSATTMVKSYTYQNARQTPAAKAAGSTFFENEAAFLKTINKDPDNINQYIQLSNLYLSETILNKTTQNNIVKLINKMISVESNNPTVLQKSAQLSAKLGDNKNALKYYNQALKIDHFNTKLYEDSIKWKIKSALKYKKNNKQNLSTELTESALSDYKQLLYWNDKFSKSNLKEEFNGRNFHISNEVFYYSSLAYFLMEDYETAIELTSQVNTEHKLYLNAVALKIICLEKNGDTIESNELFSNTIKINKNLNDKVAKFINILY
ncbi:O-antigen ligase family protein [Bacillus marasmi]|uniref:O-antigen ligase family protein n=1 Tax=Bacillus marasmi TaxID=1926279 RepID=UPI0011C9539D|nr:O-antigen ligase family protein [Bacillus marasmi]